MFPASCLDVRLSICRDIDVRRCLAPSATRPPHPPPRGAEPGDSGDSIQQPLCPHLGRNELSSERRLHRRGEISPWNLIDAGPTPQAARLAQRGDTAGTGAEPITLEALVIGLHLNQSGERSKRGDLMARKQIESLVCVVQVLCGSNQDEGGRMMPPRTGTRETSLFGLEQA